MKFLLARSHMGLGDNGMSTYTKDKAPYRIVVLGSQR